MTKSMTLEEFLLKANSVHENKYNYSSVNTENFKNTKSKVPILCIKHNKEFIQVAKNHLDGSLCPDCSIESANKKKLESKSKEFFDIVKENFGDTYDYTKSVYVSAKQNIIIICRTHGEFKMRPSAHKDGAHCPSCAIITRGEKKSTGHDAFIKKCIE